MNVQSSLRSLVALAAAAAAACSAAAPPASEQRFEANLRVLDDDATPLAGASFGLGQQTLGTTSAAGTLAVRLRGSEGQPLKLTLDCPDGYAPPSTLPTLRLTRTRRVGQHGTEPLSFEATCTRQSRNVALVVHALQGARLPVLVNGSEQAKTDADGTAHLLFKVDRAERAVTVRLDTTARPELKPARPERTFELSGRDAVLLFEPSFTAAPPKRPASRAASASPPRHIPYRID